MNMKKSGSWLSTALRRTGQEEAPEGTGFRVDFDKLKAINPDTIGWIRFSPEPSVINYPIVQGADNDKYLHQTFSAQ